MPVLVGSFPATDLRIGTTPVQAVYAGNTLVWHRTPLSVSVAPPSVSGTSVTDSVSASASGGSGTYTYQWKRVSGPLAIHPTFPTSPTTEFERLGEQTGTGTWCCRVSDGSQSVDSAPVLVQLTGGGGGGILPPMQGTPL